MSVTENYGTPANVKNSYDNQFYTLPDSVDIATLDTIVEVLAALELSGVSLGSVSPGSVTESLSKSVNKIKSDNKNKTVKTLVSMDASFSIMADFQETSNPEVNRLYYGVGVDASGNQPISITNLVDVNLVYLFWDIDSSTPQLKIGRVTASPNGDITRQGADISVMSIMFDFLSDPINVQV